jgi:RNA polymerase sigma-54 factor
LPTQAFEQRLLEEMNENPALEAGKERRWIRKDEFESEDYDDYDDSESDRVEAEDINIDEYLSSDDTPDYKTQTNNYSDDDEERESPLAAPLVFIRISSISWIRLSWMTTNEILLNFSRKHRRYGLYPS